MVQIKKRFVLKYLMHMSSTNIGQRKVVGGSNKKSFILIKAQLGVLIFQVSDVVFPRNFRMALLLWTLLP